MNVIEPGTKPGIIPQATPDSPYWRMIWTMMPFGFSLLLFVCPDWFLFKKVCHVPDGADIITLVWCIKLTNGQLDALIPSFQREPLKKIIHRLFTFAMCLWVTYDTHKRLFKSQNGTIFDAYALCRSMIITYIMKKAKLY